MIPKSVWEEVGGYDQTLRRGYEDWEFSIRLGARGKFGVGDLVRCVSESGEEVARGLISYDTKEVELIKGQRSSRILKLLGYTKGDEIIHRDDLVLL